MKEAIKICKRGVGRGLRNSRKSSVNFWHKIKCNNRLSPLLLVPGSAEGSIFLAL